MNNISINGNSFSVTGNSIVMKNNQVYVDGVLVDTGALSGNVTIEFIGDIANLDTDGSATIKGNVIGNANAGGSIRCNDVGGSVSAGGSVACKKVQGRASAGGSIRGL